MLHRESGVFKTSYAADMALYPLPIARWTVAAIAVLLVLVLPLSLHEYYISVLNLVLIAVVGALGLNILVGYTGQISVGHAAFMSVGAYTAANLAVHLHLPFWVTLPAGGLMAALIGAIVGIPSLRIKGLYLASSGLSTTRPPSPAARRPPSRCRGRPCGAISSRPRVSSIISCCSSRYWPPWRP
jgi:branched-chain amino acid transport system permease protein